MLTDQKSLSLSLSLSPVQWSFLVPSSLWSARHASPRPAALFRRFILLPWNVAPSLGRGSEGHHRPLTGAGGASCFCWIKQISAFGGKGFVNRAPACGVEDAVAVAVLKHSTTHDIYCKIVLFSPSFSSPDARPPWRVVCCSESE